jgi:hypothetical protein
LRDGLRVAQRVDAPAMTTGTSVAIIERHHSYLTPRMAARELE